MSATTLPPSAALKLDLLFEGIRYSEALGEAGQHALPNFYPYRFLQDEPNPTGQRTAQIPYLLTLGDGTLVRLRGDGSSTWFIGGSEGSGYRIERQGLDDSGESVDFEPLPRWMERGTNDGFPMSQTGVSLHGDMAVINIAPGCEYFTAGVGSGESLRCSFCAYGAPDERSRRLGQADGQAAMPQITLTRLQETLTAALEEVEIRHIYLVGGSMVDWALEAERYMQLAVAVKEVNQHRIPVTCGSGALPDDSLRRLHGDGLVDAVCFNLEVWSEALFSKICPGKNRYVGYRRWIESLEMAATLWGPGRVYSAMVAGLELESEYELSADAAAALALEGAEELCARGIIPIYSLYYPFGGSPSKESVADLRRYFETVALGYRQIRCRFDLQVWEGFMCHRCAYMQVECDLDRAE